MAENIIALESNFPRIIPARLKEAREALALNRTELASRIFITPQAVSQYEQGTKQPNPETMRKLVEVLRQPIGYFTSERPFAGDDSPTVFYRSFKSKTQTSNRAFKIWINWIGQVGRYLAEYINLPALGVPYTESESQSGEYTDEEIELAATECRRSWGLGDGPIGNLVALLESKGVTCVRGKFGVVNVDACSRWQNERPYIFLGSDKGSACRSRFDAAHELAHLILHRAIPQDELESDAILERVESEANRFASAFLLPAKTFTSEIFSSRLGHFIELKKRWKVAIQAMVYRCSDLGVFDDHQILNIRKQISANKWRKWEPLDSDIPVETPSLLKKSVELLMSANVKTAGDILADLKLSDETIALICGVKRLEAEEPESKPISVSPRFKIVGG